MAEVALAPFVAPQAPDLPAMHQALTVVVEEFGHFQNLPAVDNGQNILAAIQQLTQQMNAGQQQMQQQLAATQAGQQQMQQQIQQQLAATQQQVQQQFAATQQQIQVNHQQSQANHHQSQAQIQQLNAAVQGLNQRCFLIEETMAGGFQELAWETAASRARTLNASTSAMLQRIGPKPGRPAYQEADWPGIHQRILLLNEASCNRLGLSWDLGFDEHMPLEEKQTLIGHFLGRNMS